MHRLRHPLGLSLAATASIQLLGILTGILLARTLGPEGRGELAAVLLWPTVIVAAGGIGMTDAVTYYAARRTIPAGTLAGTTVALALLLGALLAAIGLIAVALALSGQDHDVRVAGYLFVANIPLALLALGPTYVLNGLQRFGWFNALRVLVIASSAAAIAILAAADELTVTSATVAYLAGTLLTAATAVLALRRAVGSLGRFSRSVARDVLTFGAKGQLSAMSGLLNERLDQLVISVALAPADLGLYVVAWTLASPMLFIGFSVAVTALPVVAGRSSPAERTRSAHRYISLAFVGSLAIGLPLALAAPALIDLFFGAEFEDAGDSARVLALAGIALAVGRTAGAVLKGLGDPMAAGIAEACGLALTVVGLAVLLPTMGILGAAVTSLAAYATTAVYGLWRASRALEVSWAGLLMPTRDTMR